MALKSTIFKAQVQLSDMDRHVYESLSITVARHPSENDERMMCRLLAYLLNYHERLSFTKGLCVDEEPEIWHLSFSDEIELWIDFGLVDEKRIRKACGRAQKVMVYGYGAGDFDNWWQKTQDKVKRFDNLEIFHIPQAAIGEMVSLVNRSMDLQCTIDNGEVWLTDGTASATAVLQQLK